MRFALDSDPTPPSPVPGLPTLAGGNMGADAVMVPVDPNATANRAVGSQLVAMAPHTLDRGCDGHGDRADAETPDETERGAYALTSGLGAPTGLLTDDSATVVLAGPSTVQAEVVHREAPPPPAPVPTPVSHDPTTAVLQPPEPPIPAPPIPAPPPSSTQVQPQTQAPAQPPPIPPPQAPPSRGGCGGGSQVHPVVTRRALNAPAASASPTQRARDDYQNAVSTSAFEALRW